MAEEQHAQQRESLVTALNHDALEEVFVHCSPADLLAVRQTCRQAADLLTRSEKVWVAKLRESFGLGLKVGGRASGAWRARGSRLRAVQPTRAGSSCALDSSSGVSHMPPALHPAPRRPWRRRATACLCASPAACLRPAAPSSCASRACL